MLFGKKKKKILVNYILQVLLLPAAAPNPTGAGCLFYYSLVGGSRSTDTFSEQQIQIKKKELNFPTLNRETLS